MYSDVDVRKYIDRDVSESKDLANLINSVEITRDRQREKEKEREDEGEYGRFIF